MVAVPTGGRWWILPLWRDAEMEKDAAVVASSLLLAAAAHLWEMEGNADEEEKRKKKKKKKKKEEREERETGSRKKKKGDCGQDGALQWTVRGLRALLLWWVAWRARLLPTAREKCRERERLTEREKEMQGKGETPGLLSDRKET